jgi:hypothetical protein
MPAIAVIHAWLATAAAILAAGAAILGALVGLGAAGGRAARLWLDRLVLALLVVIGADVILGGLVAILGLGDRAGPADPLHLVYAMVALLTMPVVRLEAMRRRSARIGWWVCAGGLVTLGALLRLWATGG